MLGNDYEGQVCSIARSLELVGERWSLLVIREVFRGNRRFGQMLEGMGVARNILASRLQRLCDAGILERRPYGERPDRFEYFLTEKGLDLWPVMVSLLHWGNVHEPLPHGPPMLLLHKGECQGEIDDRRICTRCGKHLGPREAVAVDGPGLKPALEALGTAA